MNPEQYSYDSGREDIPHRTSGLSNLPPKTLSKALFKQSDTVALHASLQDWALGRALAAQQAGDMEGFTYAQEVYEQAKTTAEALRSADKGEILAAYGLQTIQFMGHVALRAVEVDLIPKPIEEGIKVYPRIIEEKPDRYSEYDEKLLLNEKNHFPFINKFGKRLDS